MVRDMKAIRQGQIQAMLARHEICTVAELVRGLGVSPSTIRRDLADLAARGEVVRERGGARSADSSDADEATPFVEVAEHNRLAKEAIARRAVSMVADGDVVIIDIGTTTRLLARHLRGRAVTVVTTSLTVLDELRPDPATEVILVGGVLRRAYHSLVGVIAEDVLSKLSADLAFLGTSGVNARGQVLDTSLVEVPVKRAMLRAAGRHVLLADHDKFPGAGALEVTGVEGFDAVVTDHQTGQEALDMLADRQVEVVVA